MNESDRVKDYDQHAADPFWWSYSAYALLNASDHLFVQYNTAQTMMIKKKGGRVPPEAEWLTIVFSLRGRGLECLLKALCAKNGVEMSKDGRLTLNSHKLVDLAKQSGLELSEEEEQLLSRFTKAIEWGTYPMPISFQTWRLPIEGVTGGIPPISVWKPSDIDDSIKLQNKIIYQLNSDK